MREICSKYFFTRIVTNFGYDKEKNVEYNLSMALCLQKTGELAKAEEFYEYSYDKKPKEPKVLAAIFKFYDEFMKDPIKAQNYIE